MNWCFLFTQGDRVEEKKLVHAATSFIFLFVRMARYLLTSKGNWKNFMAYEDWVFKSEVLCIGGRFYLAELINYKELIPKGNPLKQSEFILAQ